MPAKKMVIKTESPIVTEITKNHLYEINYKVLRKGSETKVDIIFEDCNYLTHRVSCGCTKPSIEILPKGFKATIKYDSNKMGSINQFAEITTDKGKTRINLKGTIV